MDRIKLNILCSDGIFWFIENSNISIQATADANAGSLGHEPGLANSNAQAAAHAHSGS